MEVLDIAMIVFISGVAIVTAIGFFRSNKNKDEK